MNVVRRRYVVNRGAVANVKFSRGKVRKKRRKMLSDFVLSSDAERVQGGIKGRPFDWQYMAAAVWWQVATPTSIFPTPFVIVPRFFHVNMSPCANHPFVQNEDR